MGSSHQLLGPLLSPYQSDENSSNMLNIHCFRKKTTAKTAEAFPLLLQEAKVADSSRVDTPTTQAASRVLLTSGPPSVTLATSFLGSASDIPLK